MRTLKLLLPGTCLALMVSTVAAQTPSPIRQVESDQQRRQMERDARPIVPGETAPELYPGEATDIGPQSILTYKPRKTYIEAMVDGQYFYTDNMFLDETNRQATDVFVATAQFALAPTPYDLWGGKLGPRIGYRHQWYMYGLLNDDTVQAADFETTPPSFPELELRKFDFNAQTIFTDGRWTLGNWAFELGFDYTRLMESDDYDQFYQEYVPRLGVQRVFPLYETGALSLGYAGDYRFTDTDLPPPVFNEDFNDRTDHSLYVSFAQSLCRHAVLQPYYRFKYTRFTEGDERDDYLHSFGVAVHCFFTEQIALRAFAGYDMLESSNPVIPDYRRLDTGGGLNLTFRF